MLDPAPASSTARRVLQVGACAILGAGVFAAISDEALGGFFIVTLVGGVVGAGALIAIGRRQHHVPLAVHDPFAQAPQSDAINVSRIRVAGVGGFGLVVVAVAMAFTFPQIGVSLALGLVGGFLIALALIPYRRHHAGRRP